MFSLEIARAQLTFSRTRPKFGKIFVVMALMHCGHSCISGNSCIAAIEIIVYYDLYDCGCGMAAGTLALRACFLMKRAHAYTTRGDFCQKGDKIMMTKF